MAEIAQKTGQTHREYISIQPTAITVPALGQLSRLHI
jgi:hypothetical protein